MAIFSGIEGDSNAAAGSAANSQAKLQKDLNRFLSLLVTQLKHQDPLDPMDASEFTSQLVEFAGVEQQIKQNSHLENMLKLQETGQVANMVTYIGTKIEASGDDFMLKDGQAKMSYTLPDDILYKSVKITIEDASGGHVITTDGTVKAGKHFFEWDGKNGAGSQMKDGKYTITVHAQDREGKQAKVSYSVFGVVTGMAAEDGVLQMYMDDVKVPFANVLSVHKGENEVAAAPAADPEEDPEDPAEDPEDPDDPEDPAADPPAADPPAANPQTPAPDTATHEYTYDEVTVTTPQVNTVTRTVTKIPGEDTVVTTTPVTTSVVIP